MLRSFSPTGRIVLVASGSGTAILGGGNNRDRVYLEFGAEQQIRYPHAGARGPVCPKHFGAYFGIYRVIGEILDIGGDAHDILKACPGALQGILDVSKTLARLDLKAAFDDGARRVASDLSGDEDQKLRSQGYDCRGAKPAISFILTPPQRCILSHVLVLGDGYRPWQPDTPNSLWALLYQLQRSRSMSVIMIISYLFDHRYSAFAGREPPFGRILGPC